jgi:hypothetical protein
MNELYYSDGVRWLPLPQWASFFLHLGEALSSHISLNKRLIATVAVPTRSYAAALAAFGAVIERASIPAATIAVQEYFQLLVEAEKGTPVTLLRRGIRHKGITDGHLVAHEKMWLRIKVRGGELGAWEWVGEEEAQKVELVSNQEEEAVPKRITGKVVMPLSAFAETLIGSQSAASFGSISRCECAVVGHLTNLKPEILETRFAVQRTTTDFDQGVLQDVLRAREFLAAGEHFRSVLVSALNRSGATCPSAVPSVVVFDGSTAFLRSRGVFSSANWLVILDRRDATFGDAMAACNQDYAKRKADDIRFDTVVDLPAGIDLVTYYEAR